MPPQDMQAARGAWQTSFPQADGVIFTATGKHMSMGTEGDRPHPITVSGQDVDDSSCRHLPYVDCLILSAAGKDPSLWTENNGSGSVIAAG